MARLVWYSSPSGHMVQDVPGLAAREIEGEIGLEPGYRQDGADILCVGCGQLVAWVDATGRITRAAAAHRCEAA